MRGNFAHYRSLYSILFIVVMVYTVLSSPLLLLGLAVLAGAWSYAFILTAPDTPLTIAGVELRRCAAPRRCASSTPRALRTLTGGSHAHVCSHLGY